MNDGFKQGAPPGEPDDTIEALIGQIEAALQSSFGGDEHVLRVLEQRAADAGMALDMWLEAASQQLAVTHPSAGWAETARRLAERIAADPPRSLKAQTARGAIAFYNLPRS